MACLTFSLEEYDMTMLQPASNDWFYSDTLENNELLAVRAHIVAGKSKIDAIAEYFPEYRAVMEDDEISLKSRKAKLRSKASSFFNRPKIRNYIADCRQEVAKQAGLEKAEWVEQLVIDAETCRDADQYMATAKNMEILGKGLGFMDSAVTVKHQHITGEQADIQIQEQMKLLLETDPEMYHQMTASMAGEPQIKQVENKALINSEILDHDPVSIPIADDSS